MNVYIDLDGNKFAETPMAIYTEKHIYYKDIKFFSLMGSFAMVLENNDHEFILSSESLKSKVKGLAYDEY